MNAYRDGDTIIAPRRAEGPDALGDAWVALEPGTPEYQMWDEWLRSIEDVSELEAAETSRSLRHTSGPTATGAMVMERAEMSTQSINDLPDSAFAYIEPGGSKDSSGRTVPRSKRHFPVHDAAHVRNALSRAPQSPFGEKAMPEIRRAAKKFGVEVGDAPRSRPHLDLCTRAFDFELDGASGDGRTLEGYAAVFNSPARIKDLQGDFDETILPGAFKRSLARRMPVLQWDHGKDPRIGTAPIGDIHELREDGHGLYVRARLYDHPDIDRVRLAIKGKSVRGMSFRFSVPDGGDNWSSRSGDVQLREIREADTHELGPVVFPAYDTTSVSVRSILSGLDAAEMRELVHELGAYLRDAVDPSDFTGRPGARSAGGGDPDTEPSSVPVPTSIDELRTVERALKALGAIDGRHGRHHPKVVHLG